MGYFDPPKYGFDIRFEICELMIYITLKFV